MQCLLLLSMSFSENPSGIRNWSLQKHTNLYLLPEVFWSLRWSLESAFTHHVLSHFSRVFPVSLLFDWCTLYSFYVREPSPWWKLVSQISWHLKEVALSGFYLQWIFLWWVQGQKCRIHVCGTTTNATYFRSKRNESPTLTTKKREDS